MPLPFLLLCSFVAIYSISFVAIYSIGFVAIYSIGFVAIYRVSFVVINSISFAAIYNISFAAIHTISFAAIYRASFVPFYSISFVVIYSISFAAIYSISFAAICGVSFVVIYSISFAAIYSISFAAICGVSFVAMTDLIHSRVPSEYVKHTHNCSVPYMLPSRNLWNPGGGFDWISAFSGAVGLVIVSSCFYIQFICTLFLTHFEGFPLNWRWEKWLEFARSRAESHSIPVAYESKILLDWSQSGRPPIKGHLYRKNSLQIFPSSVSRKELFCDISSVCPSYVQTQIRR